MTNAEAIKWLELQRSVGIQWDDDSEKHRPFREEAEKRISEAYSMAIDALLKEQEARVLSAEEMAQIEPDTVYWGEGNHVRNLWPMAFTDKTIEDFDSGFLKDSYGRIYEVELYNKGVMGWRLWTSRPTDEQRKAVAWDD